MTDVDCMSCLVNLARGLEVMNDWSVRWKDEITHVMVYEMGPGRIRAACGYVPNLLGEWRRKDLNP